MDKDFAVVMGAVLFSLIYLVAIGWSKAKRLANKEEEGCGGSCGCVKAKHH